MIRPWLDAGQLARRIAELGAEISVDYRGRDPILVGILRGAFIFLSDLARHLDVDCSFDFMAVSSYGGGTQSSGVVRILKDLDETIQGRNVILVEDIVDTGLTLQYLTEFLSNRAPASLAVCALLDKRECRRVAVPVRYVGFTIPNRFVVGYGLDHDQHYRNLPYIGVLESEAEAAP